MNERSSIGSKSANARFLMSLAVSQFRRLVQPSLVAVYGAHPKRPEIPVQVGTGFLLAHGNRPVFVTAKHTLRGPGLDEPPGQKAVHIDGRWVYMGDGPRDLIEPASRDLAFAFMDEFPLRRCLASPQFTPVGKMPALATIAGFLARDFKRGGPVLRPAPRVYTGLTKAVPGGLIGVRYPHRRNVETNTGRSAVTVRPAGLSGGPIIDTTALILGTVRIVGVFTEQSNGEARGEKACFIEAALAEL